MGASKDAAVPQDAELAGLAEQLVDAARTDGVALTGPGGLLTGLVQRVLQASLETELSDHLGYERHAVEGRRSGNSRNGHFPKTVRTEIGDVVIKVPRDRNGTFEPVTVPKGVRRLEGLDAMVVSLYGKGMTTGDIRPIWRRSTGRTSPATRSAASPTPLSRT